MSLSLAVFWTLTGVCSRFRIDKIEDFHHLNSFLNWPVLSPYDLELTTILWNHLQAQPETDLLFQSNSDASDIVVISHILVQQIYNTVQSQLMAITPTTVQQGQPSYPMPPPVPVYTEVIPMWQVFTSYVSRTIKETLTKIKYETKTKTETATSTTTATVVEKTSYQVVVVTPKTSYGPATINPIKTAIKTATKTPTKIQHKTVATSAPRTSNSLITTSITVVTSPTATVVESTNVEPTNIEPTNNHAPQLSLSEINLAIATTTPVQAPKNKVQAKRQKTNDNSQMVIAVYMQACANHALNAGSGVIIPFRDAMQHWLDAIKSSMPENKTVNKKRNIASRHVRKAIKGPDHKSKGLKQKAMAQYTEKVQNDRSLYKTLIQYTLPVATVAWWSYYLTQPEDYSNDIPDDSPDMNRRLILNRAWNMKTLCTEQIHDQQIKELCLKALGANNKLQAMLLTRFGLSGWTSTDFHTAGPITVTADNTLESDERQYGMTGYIQDEFSALNHSPVSYLKAEKYRKIVTEVVTHLAATTSKELLEAAIQTRLDPLAQVLIWCGIPDKEAESLFNGCMDVVANKLKKGSLDWYEHDRHKQYFHAYTGLIRGPTTKLQLSFLPFFTFDKDMNYGKMHYESRILSLQKPQLPSSNLPLSAQKPTTDNSVSFDTVIPAGSQLLVWDNDYWHFIQTIEQSTYNLKHLDSNKIYGIVQEGQRRPQRFFVVHNQELIESPLLTDIAIARFWLFSRLSETTPMKFTSYQKQKKKTEVITWASVTTIYELIYWFGINKRYRNNQVLPHSSLLTFCIITTLAHLFDYIRQSERLSGSSSAIRFISAIELAAHYLHKGDYKKLNILYGLTLQSESLLGVFNFEFQSEGYYKGVNYLPLNALLVKNQIHIFDLAYKNCKDIYGDCSPHNREHLDFIAFSVSVCRVNLQDGDCKSLWENASAREIWKFFSRSLDPFSQRIDFINATVADGAYITFPSLYRLDNGWNLAMDSNLQQPFTDNIQIVKLDGRHRCNIRHACVVIGNETYIKTTFSQLWLCKEKSSDCHLLINSKHGLATPHWKEEAAWQAESILPVEPSDDLYCRFMPYSNLREVCFSSIGNPNRMATIRELEKIFNSEIWVPVRTGRYTNYQTSEGYPVVRYYTSDHMPVIRLIPERLEEHVRFMERNEFLRQSDAGIDRKLLMFVGMLAPKLDTTTLYDRVYEDVVKLILSITPAGQRCYFSHFISRNWCQGQNSCLMALYHLDIIETSPEVPGQYPATYRVNHGLNPRLASGADLVEVGAGISATGQYALKTDHPYELYSIFTYNPYEDGVEYNLGETSISNFSPPVANLIYLIMPKHSKWYHLFMIRNEELLENACGADYRMELYKFLP